MSSRYKPVGWRNESQRHSLAARGIASNYYSKKGFSYEKLFENRAVAKKLKQQDVEIKDGFVVNRMVSIGDQYGEPWKRVGPFETKEDAEAYAEGVDSDAATEIKLVKIKRDEDTYPEWTYASKKVHGDFGGDTEKEKLRNLQLARVPEKSLKIVPHDDGSASLFDPEIDEFLIGYKFDSPEEARSFLKDAKLKEYFAIKKTIKVSDASIRRMRAIARAEAAYQKNEGFTNPVAVLKLREDPQSGEERAMLQHKGDYYVHYGQGTMTQPLKYDEAVKTFNKYTDGWEDVE